MMKKLVILLALLPLAACQIRTKPAERVRQPVDTVGFASHQWQMDSLMDRINRQYSSVIDSLWQRDGIEDNTSWRVVISPHDDYTYVGPLYPAVLKPVKARTLFMFGVAHKARLLGLEDKIVFGTYPYWKTPAGEVKISKVREELMSRLPEDLYIVSDSMEAIEHSLEALVPFIQYDDPQVEIVPILVPYMSYDRMDSIAGPVAKAIESIVKAKGWKWGKDYAIVISTDAVHYGDEDWGGQNYAPYGSDSAGYAMAVAHEHVIIDSCLAGPLKPEKLKLFTEYTVQKEDYRQYKWTWCGRYSVPLGLLTAYDLQQDLQAPPLNGVMVGYYTSIDHKSIPVKDIAMGVTAPANIHHWVGYAAIGYK
jgi:AmmeMemoRadiSam system protein B